MSIREPSIVMRKLGIKLRDIFTKGSGTRHISASRQENIRPSPLIYSLETPQFHLLKLNETNRFSGFVFDYNGKAVERMNVYLENKKVGSFKVDGLSDDIYEHVPTVKSAQHCRFDFDLYVEGHAPRYLFEVVYDDNSSELLFEYNVAEVRSLERWLNGMNKGLAGIPVPNADLVYLTQGIRDSMAYQNSIIPGIYNMKRYLISSGVDINSLQSILDLGCGTGRLTVGWYLDNPERSLSGCDINGELLAWATNNLPQEITFNQSSMTPPLPYASKSFNFIYMVSVFTHLSLDSQRLWIEELKRVICPYGHLLLTFQGEIYVRVFHPQRMDEFSETGYIEIPNSDEGSNSFGTYHGFEFVEALFSDFEIIGYWPRGNINYPEVVFPVAAFQDVYVLKCCS